MFEVRSHPQDVSGRARPRGPLAVGLLAVAAMVGALLAATAPPAAAAPPEFHAFDNGKIRAGGSSVDPGAVDRNGNLSAPSFRPDGGAWTRLTHDLPVEVAVGSGVGNDGHWSDSFIITNLLGAGAASVDASGFVATATQGAGVSGHGTITSTAMVGSSDLEIRHTYELGVDDRFIRVETRVTNTSDDIHPNVHLWTGAGDDVVGSQDATVTTRGNLEAGGFVPIGDRAEPAAALRMSEEGGSMLLYSAAPGAGTSIAGCCTLSNAHSTAPADSPITRSVDASYALHIPMGALDAGASNEVVWYLGATSDDRFGDLVAAVLAAEAPPAPGGGVGGGGAGSGDPTPPVRSGDRISGADRYETAAAVAAELHPTGAETVYVATGEAHPDALAAGAAAAGDDAPLLLVRHGEVPAPTAAALEALDAATVVIVGGPAVISAAVEGELSRISGARVVRVSGPDRYATAAALALRSHPSGVATVYIATGTAFADALTGGAAANDAGAALLLTDPNALPQWVADALTTLGPDRIVIVGGEAAVSARVEASLRSFADVVERVSGPDRYATATALAGGARGGTIVVVTGQAFPDALVGTTVAARLDGPVLLVAGDEVPPSTRTAFVTIAPHHMVVIGGPSATGPQAELALARLLAAASSSTS